jgi:CRP-like cAMP-binding protein
MTKKAKKVQFDPKTFLATVGGGRTLLMYRTDKIIFSQGDPADAVFYIQKGQVKITVVSEQGKEAIVAVLGPDEFCGGVPDGTAAAHGYSHRNDRLRDHAPGEGGHHPRSP